MFYTVSHCFGKAVISSSDAFEYSENQLFLLISLMLCFIFLPSYHLDQMFTRLRTFYGYNSGKLLSQNSWSLLLSPTFKAALINILYEKRIK